MPFPIDQLAEDLQAIERTVHVIADSPYLTRLNDRDVVLAGLVEARTRLRMIRELQRVSVPLPISLSFPGSTCCKGEAEKPETQLED